MLYVKQKGLLPMQNEYFFIKELYMYENEERGILIIVLADRASSFHLNIEK